MKNTNISHFKTKKKMKLRKGKNERPNYEFSKKKIFSGNINILPVEK